jgi:hypothetical protein
VGSGVTYALFFRPSFLVLMAKHRKSKPFSMLADRLRVQVKSAKHAVKLD